MNLRWELPFDLKRRGEKDTLSVLHADLAKEVKADFSQKLAPRAKMKCHTRRNIPSLHSASILLKAAIPSRLNSVFLFAKAPLFRDQWRNLR